MHRLGYWKSPWQQFRLGAFDVVGAQDMPRVAHAVQFLLDRDAAGVEEFRNVVEQVLSDVLAELEFSVERKIEGQYEQPAALQHPCKLADDLAIVIGVFQHRD